MVNTKVLVLSILSVIFILVLGTVGFMVIEHLTLLDAIYMTIITASTVGFGELRQQGFSPMGRIFTMGLIVMSITVGAYCISLVIAYVVEGRLGTALRRRRMEHKIERLRDHLIVCGAGKTGWEVMNEFKNRKEPFVAIDGDEELISNIMAENPGMFCIAGEATHEATLQRAGVEHAQGIVFALSLDTDNIVGVLTARSLNPHVLIIARGENQESVGKLTRAGANHIILPTQLAGKRIASFVLNPSVVDFLDCMTRDSGLQLLLEDVAILEGSPLKGKMLRDSRIREKSNAIVVAIRRDMEYMVNPPVDTVLATGDVLLVLGRQEQLVKLFAYTGGELGWRARTPRSHS